MQLSISPFFGRAAALVFGSALVLFVGASCSSNVSGQARDGEGGAGGANDGADASGGRSASGGDAGSGGSPAASGGSEGMGGASEGTGGSDSSDVDPCQAIVQDAPFGCAPSGDVTLSENTTWTPGCRSFGSLTIGATARVTLGTTPADGPSLVVADVVLVEAGGELSVSGQGYGPDEGPGAGSATTDPLHRSGGGHGGKGGDKGAVLGGSTYGDASYPVTAGSGGGGGPEASSGGGALLICARQSITVDGTVSSNGGLPYPGPGAGAGGSVLLISPTIAGSGAVTARGGSRGGTCFALGGGGGGGRIALLSDELSFTGDLDVTGGYTAGAGYEIGCNGSIEGSPGTVAYGPFPD